MRTNYILIDYENVQPAALPGLDADHFRVLLFVGATQSKLPLDIVCAMQAMGPRGEYLKTGGSGRNALDFHIAFHIGRLSTEDPSGTFHIISKDTGYDPLIQHLKDRKITAARWKTVEEISSPKTAGAKPLPAKPLSGKLLPGKLLPGKLEVVVANLRQRGAARPRTVKTLTSTISSLFKKKPGEADPVTLLAEMQKRGFIAIHEDKVSYTLD